MLNLLPLYGIIIDGNKISGFCRNKRETVGGNALTFPFLPVFAHGVRVGKYMWKFYAVYDTL